MKVKDEQFTHMHDINFHTIKVLCTRMKPACWNNSTCVNLQMCTEILLVSLGDGGSRNPAGKLENYRVCVENVLTVVIL